MMRSGQGSPRNARSVEFSALRESSSPEVSIMARSLAAARVAAFVAAGLGIVLACGSALQAEPHRGTRAAEEAVQEALQREIYGLTTERDSLLHSAAAQSPQYAP